MLHRKDLTLIKTPKCDHERKVGESNWICIRDAHPEHPDAHAFVAAPREKRS